MIVKGKITVAEIEDGVSRSTGNEWRKCHYVLAYKGKYANGTECTRTLAFNVFGRDRLNQLKILEGMTGELEFETKGEIRTAQSGSKYETLEVDILNWKADSNQPEPKPIKANPQTSFKPAPQPAPKAEGDETDGFPF